jgi:integrase
MVKFHLDKKEGQESPIFLSLHHRGKRIKVFTGKKIVASKWNIKSGRANPRKYKNNCVGFNEFLQGISNEVEKLVNDNRSLTKAEIKSIVNKANGKTSTDSFFGFSEAYINSQVEKGDLKPLSAKPYTGTLNHLKEVDSTLNFDDVNLDFYDKFVRYLKGKSLASNSIGGHIKRLKWFLAAALDRDLHSNVAFKKKAFKASRDDTDQIYLTRSEIKKLADKEMSERLRRIADAFVMNCYLGMRFADLNQISKENFKKEGDLYYLQMVQGKTNEKISIPVPPEVLPLLRKYKFTCPVVRSNGKLISVQKFNEYLKEAAEKAELDEVEEIRKDGTTEKLAKYDLIKSHTARRSFCTNLYLDGVPIQNIMAISGHKKEETFLLYVRADQLTKSKGLAKHYKDKLRIREKA